MLARSATGLHGQRGLSLVELLVGVAVGLLVVAGAATVTATQLSDSRRLVVEAQVQQDLRATADIMTRELRRAGEWGSASASGIWSPTSVVTPNPYASITLAGTPTNEVDFSYQGALVSGFQFVSGSPGVIQLNLSAPGNPANWQPLTDPATLDVTAVSITLQPVATIPPVVLACAALCADTTKNCWPTLEVRELLVQITGRAVNDHNVQRTIGTHVRLRNDRIVNNNAGGPLCPP